MLFNIPKQQIFHDRKSNVIKGEKNMDACQHPTILILKGSLLSKGRTGIIHIMDQDKGFHSNTFETASGKSNEARQYIAAFIGQENLWEAMTLK